MKRTHDVFTVDSAPVPEMSTEVWTKRVDDPSLTTLRPVEHELAVEVSKSMHRAAADLVRELDHKPA